MNMTTRVDSKTLNICRPRFEVSILAIHQEVKWNKKNGDLANVFLEYNLQHMLPMWFIDTNTQRIGPSPGPWQWSVCHVSEANIFFKDNILRAQGFSRSQQHCSIPGAYWGVTTELVFVAASERERENPLKRLTLTKHWAATLYSSSSSNPPFLSRSNKHSKC